MVSQMSLVSLSGDEEAIPMNGDTVKIQFNDKIEKKPINHYTTKLTKDDLDMLIVCKIENEFGYPEQYIEECLRTHQKNDATTCYYLLKKQDKHELINLL